MIKRVAKMLSYRSGLLSAQHRRRNRRTLTVVLFHRVIPDRDPAWVPADPEWSVTTEFFEQSVAFFRRHYSFVSYDQVRRAHQEGEALPDRALLISFDDGWRCNLQHAAPILEKYGAPAVLFVTTGVIGMPMLSWQESLFAIWKGGGLDKARLAQIGESLQITIPGNVSTEKEYAELVGTLRALPTMDRRRCYALFVTWAEELPGIPYMLSETELREISKKGFSLGTHGVTHDAMTDIPDLLEELTHSRQKLKEVTGDGLPDSMAFPQGSYDPGVFDLAFANGYTTLFSGKKCINRIGERAGGVDLGRVNINQLELQYPDGNLNRALLALELFRQPIA